MAKALTRYTIPSSAKIVVGRVHIMNTGLELDLLLRDPAADKNFFRVSELGASIC